MCRLCRRRAVTGEVRRRHPPGYSNIPLEGMESAVAARRQWPPRKATLPQITVPADHGPGKPLYRSFEKV